MEGEDQSAIPRRTPMLLAVGVVSAFAIGGGIGMLLPGSPLKARVASPVTYVAPLPAQPAPPEPLPQVIPPATLTGFAAPDDPAPRSPAPHINVAAQVGALNDQMQAAFADCDRRSKTLADLLMRVGREADLMDEARSTAQSARDACVQGADRIQALSPPPGARGKARADFQQAFELCADAMQVRANGLAQVSSILDGQISQSAIDQLRQSTRGLRDRELRCGFQFFAAAREMQADALR